jgi:DNA-directed RNA polymerase subunit RPC12/RpoP
MQRIPDPNLAYSVKHGVSKGDGDITYTCATCSTPLIENAHKGQFAGSVHQCHVCNSYNVIGEGG